MGVDSLFQFADGPRVHFLLRVSPPEHIVQQEISWIQLGFWFFPLIAILDRTNKTVVRSFLGVAARLARCDNSAAKERHSARGVSSGGSMGVRDAWIEKRLAETAANGTLAPSNGAGLVLS